ncbi:hypothetical protein CRG98_008726 [Punica granatum]|uniref:Uncharacterized protein n=1 Tax=Punica granatum TaxID=22663 RepID=A0A2I0KQQ6_PUNGR|nr:hypothetical protein CRG98_008726 [Punica granatum]
MAGAAGDDPRKALELGGKQGVESRVAELRESREAKCGLAVRGQLRGEESVSLGSLIGRELRGKGKREVRELEHEHRSREGVAGESMGGAVRARLREKLGFP